MKYSIAFLLAFASFTFCASGCNKGDQTLPTQNNGSHNNQTGTKMKITVGTTVFKVTLTDNATTAAFKAMLPLTINMSELNANEKYFYFSTTLPVNASLRGNVQAGDLMLYGNNCLVLFYESFNTSYNYTRLGKIDNVNGLKAALGIGDASVRFELG